MSQEKKMNALKELATILKDKGTPAPELWKAGGFAAAKRLKDVEQAIVALRKTFSTENKARTAEDERAEAEAAGISLDELREQQKKKRDTEHQQDKRRLDDERKSGRETKINVTKLAQGEFDLQTEYVGGDD
jgi:hypothetical protein